MRVALLLALLLVASAPGYAEAGGTGIPWDEFKTLYRQSIEREIMKKAARPEGKLQVYTIDEARYTLRVDSAYAHGEALLTGRIVAGKPEPIPLFGNEVVVTSVERTAGGMVLLLPDREGMFFLPDEGATEFQILASFSVRTGEDAKSTTVMLSIPQALRNTLDIELPEGSRLVGRPGIAGADGSYRFSASSRLLVKYVDSQDLAAEAVLEVDAVSRITVQKDRIFIATHFLPVRPLPGPLVLHAPQGAQFISSSLRTSWIESLEDDEYVLNLPAGHRGSFSIEFAVALSTEVGDVSLSLPVIEGNTGEQGRFVVDEPDDGQVTVTSQGIVSRSTAERLGEFLRAKVEQHQSYRSTSTPGQLRLAIERFQPAGTPVTVLDDQYFFTSFEESGNILSVLVLDAPPELGRRLRLKAVPDADIWSLTVNGEKQEVYAGENDTWIIPLDGGQASHVVLAFLRKGTQLSLQGRLEVLVPETGLPCRELRVGVALPGRVELLSMDGPVNPAVGDEWESPAEFVGKRHFFSRTFYMGEGMTLAAFYKEPVSHAQQRKGAIR